MFRRHTAALIIWKSDTDSENPASGTATPIVPESIVPFAATLH
jgi:hypothetical protein